MKKNQHQQPRVGRSFRHTAKGLIFLQLLTPLTLTLTPNAFAEQVDLPELNSSHTQNDEQVRSQRDQQRLLQAVTGASQLAGADSSDGQKSAAAGLVSGAASSEAEQWLSRFGTTRLQLGLDGDLRTDGSALDLLMPIYDNQRNLFFTQYGLRHKDQRSTYNLGVGARYFDNNWMYGSNFFFDHDVTGANRRIGMGGEAWTDWLRFSGNYYVGMTDWHHSRDFSDFEERPANGWDLRSEGWLPAYPQLGGKLLYEKYHGDEVALFGKGRRAKDPYAVTAGLNWTPIPLVTISTEHRMGSDSRTDSQISLGFTLHSDLSLARHFDSESVAGTRLLAASRLDLVERNNNIVLDYRKETLVSLRLPLRVQGLALELIPIALQVSSKYGVSRIEWSAASLENAGGKVTGQGLQWSIQMPDFVVGQPNQYTLIATAYDSKGNRSATASTVVTVGDDTAAFDAANSTLTSNSTQILADGQEETTLSMTAMDSNNQMLTGRAVTFEVTGASRKPGDYTIGAVTEMNGVYSATLVTTSPGIMVVSARIDGVRVKGQELKILATPTAAQQTASSLFGSVPGDIRIPADGVATSELRFVVLDAAGHPLAAQKVGVLLDGRRIADSTSDANGEASVVIPATTLVRDATVIASLSNDAQSIQTVRVKYEADVTSATLKRNDLTAFAESNMSYRVNARVTDVGGNPVPGVSVDFSTTSAALSVSASSAITDQKGIASVIATASGAGSYSVEARVNGTEQSVSFDCEPITAAQALVDSSRSSLNSSRTNLPADNASTATMQFAAKDSQGHPVRGLTGVSFLSAGLTEVVIGDPIETEPGIYQASLRGNSAGVATISVKLNGVTLPGLSFSVQFDAIKGNSLERIDDLNVTLGAAERALTLTGGNQGPVTYHSSRPDVVSISPSGVLRFLTLGDDVLITVSESAHGKYLAQAQTFHVSVKPSSYNLLWRPADAIITYGGGTVWVTAGIGNGGTLTFVADDPSIARTVGDVHTATGSIQIQALAAGTTFVTITEQASPGFIGQSTRALVRVDPGMGVDLVPPAAINVQVGDAGFTPTVGGGNGGVLSYESANPAVVTVNPQGELQFVGAGSTTITVTEQNANYVSKRISYRVSVRPATGNLLVAPADIEMNIDSPDNAPVIAGGNGGARSFASSNPQVVQVDKSGVLKAVGAGNAVITVIEAAQTGFDSQAITYSVNVLLLEGRPLTRVGASRRYLARGAVCEARNLVSGGNGGNLVVSTESPLLMTIKGTELTMEDYGYGYFKVTEPAHGSYAEQSVTIAISIAANYTAMSCP